MINESKNYADGILAILSSFHKYVPYYDIEVWRSRCCWWSVECTAGVNGHSTLANEEGAGGLHFEIVDWHSGNKFLEVLNIMINFSFGLLSKYLSRIV